MSYVVDKTRKTNNYGKYRKNAYKGTQRKIDYSDRRIATKTTIRNSTRNRNYNNQNKNWSKKEILVLQCIVASVLLVGVLLFKYVEIEEIKEIKVIQVARVKLEEYIPTGIIEIKDVIDKTAEKFKIEIKDIYNISKEEIENTENTEDTINIYKNVVDAENIKNIENDKNIVEFRIDEYILSDMNNKN